MQNKAFGKRDLQHIDKIKLGGNSTSLIQIKYKDKKGKETIRLVEPYKVDGEDFWGYDPNKDAIRRFKIRSIRSVKPTNQQYQPRWGIEMDKKAMYYAEICKTASLKEDVKLNPHQERAVKRDGSSVIYAHGVGSGKTLTGIARFEKLRADGKANKALVIVPASLRDNFANSGVSKFTNSKANIIGNKAEISSKLYGDIDPTADYNIISYEMFRSNPKKYITESGADTIITDETHRQKNETAALTKKLRDTRGMYKNYIGLTGSVISNDISDVLPLVDVASNGKHQLGKNKKEFADTFLKRSSDKKYRKTPKGRIPVTGLNNKEMLSKNLNQYIDYLDNDDVKEVAKMPNKQVNLVRVPISRRQARIYKDLLNEDKKVKKMITAKRLETLKDEEIARAYSKLNESRKLMNSIGSVHPGIDISSSAKITPKTKKLLDDLQNHLQTTPDGQALLFSNLINGGTDVLEAGLKDRKIPYGRFIGKGNKGVTEKGRQQDVSDYNKRKNRVMVISGAGGEGISLGDTTWEGMLDPHFNPERMKQMEARGIRSNGLKGRKPEDRNVAVNRYMATMPKTLGLFKSRYRTPDEFIYEVANNKDRQNKLLFDLMKETRGNTNRMSKEGSESVNRYLGEMYKQATTIKELRKHQTQLSSEEKKIIDEGKAVWGDGSRAVWKSVDPKTGKATFVTNTHRAACAKPTVKGAVGKFHSFIKSTASDRYKEEIYKQAQESICYYHASPVQGIKKFRHSEDTSGNNKGKVVFVSKEPSFSAAFGLRWNDGNARLSVLTSDKKVPTEDNYIESTLKFTDEVDVTKPCSMYKLRGHFKPLRYQGDIEKYTNDDVEILSEEQFNSFEDMAKHYGLKLSKVTDGYIMNKLKGKKSSNFEKKASDENSVGADGKIPAIEKALDNSVAREVATMMATSHEYKTPNVDGALAMVKNYKWEKTMCPVNKMEGINKPVNPEKVLSIAAGIKKDRNKVSPFIIVDKLHGIRPQTPGKKILLDGHHRKEACELLKMEEVPVYKGTFTGKAQIPKQDLREKVACYLRDIMDI